MNLVTVAGHTFDLDLLPDSPCVLDGGCRPLDFTGELLKIRPNAKIVAIDADPDMKDHRDGITILRCALVGDPLTKSANYFLSPNGWTGNSVVIRVSPKCSLKKTTCRTITSIMDELGINHWDLIKLDVEGAEFGILEHWDGMQIASQLSIEFHDQVDEERFGRPWMTQQKRFCNGWTERILGSDGPLKHYHLARATRTDSLFILRDLC